MADETRPFYRLGRDLDGQVDPPGEEGGRPAVVKDRYELGAVIGSGATATVYRAYDRRLDREVAVKLFDRGEKSDERRQRQEIRVLREFDHPGLVALHDTGIEDGRGFLVMELVEGPTLAAKIRQGPLTAEETGEIGAAVADALAYVHARGITHRDLKPPNVLLGDRPMLGDFGIAQPVDATRMTVTGVVIGTAAYLAPEQVRGDEIGAPADIYALGLVLLECLTGKREYPGPMAEAAVARLHRPPSVPRDLPGGLTGVLYWMTADDPAERPSAAQVATALRDGGAGVPARILSGPGGRRHRRLVLAGVSLAALVFAGALLTRHADAPTGQGTEGAGTPAPVTAPSIPSAPSSAAPQPGPVVLGSANAAPGGRQPATVTIPAVGQPTAETPPVSSGKGKGQDKPKKSPSKVPPGRQEAP